jgi:hypothetical protein
VSKSACRRRATERKRRRAELLRERGWTVYISSNFCTHPDHPGAWTIAAAALDEGTLEDR